MQTQMRFFEFLFYSGGHLLDAVAVTTITTVFRPMGHFRICGEHTKHFASLIRHMRGKEGLVSKRLACEF